MKTLAVYLTEGFKLRDDTKVIDPIDKNKKYKSTYDIYLDEIKRYAPPKYVVLLGIGDFYETYDDCAEILSNVTNCLLSERKDYLMCGFPKSKVDNVLCELVHSQHKVKIIPWGEIKEKMNPDI